MTRINLVPPSELTDQHLFAEFREIKMVPKSLARSIAAATLRSEYPLDYVLARIPKAFMLGTGHVSFFYNRGVYLQRRFRQLREELRSRGVQFNELSELDPDGAFQTGSGVFLQDYKPTEAALQTIRARIAEKIAMKPSWYRYKGVPLSTGDAK